jgi:L-rhamnose mutarotase
MINVKEGCRDEYIRLHNQPRDAVQKVMRENGICRHAIFIKDNLLVSWFEYNGSDFETDMKAIGDNREIQKWWEKTSPLQEPVANRKEGEWWTFLEPVTFFD